MFTSFFPFVDSKVGDKRSQKEIEEYDLYCDIFFGTSFHREKSFPRRSISEKEEEIICRNTNSSAFFGPVEFLLENNSSDLGGSSSKEGETSAISSANPKKKKKSLSSMHLFKIRKEEVTHFRRKHQISAYGDDVPDPLETFQQLETDYGVESNLLENIYKLGYLNPTPIQMQAISLMLNNRQLLACAPTGSGKTAAFLIPLVHSLKEPQVGGIRAVILAPTRELVKQIHSFCLKLCEGTNLRPLVIENVKKVVEESEFLNNDILISTPNRLVYLLKDTSAKLSLDRVQWLVVDECDKLFETGKEESCFRNQLAAIYNACDSAEVKRVMFSATCSYDVEEWCKLNLDSLVCVTVGSKNTAHKAIKQELLYAGSESGKLVAFQNFIREGFLSPVLVFVQSKERAQELYKETVLSCARMRVIHSDLSQEKRDQIMEDFDNKKVWILICTDVVGRGIDFKGVNVVINYDFPTTAVSYIHRIGRTGRAGEDGRAITYFTDDDAENLRSIAQVMKTAGCEVPDYILSLKSKKKKKSELVRPIRRQNISSLSTYDSDRRKRKNKSEFVRNTKRQKISSQSTYVSGRKCGKNKSEVKRPIKQQKVSSHSKYDSGRNKRKTKKK